MRVGPKELVIGGVAVLCFSSLFVPKNDPTSVYYGTHEGRGAAMNPRRGCPSERELYEDLMLHCRADLTRLGCMSSPHVAPVLCLISKKRDASEECIATIPTLERCQPVARKAGKAS